MVSLVENGTHVLFGTTLGAYRAGETTLAHDVVAALKPGMLCLADRGFFGWVIDVNYFCRLPTIILAGPELAEDAPIPNGQLV